MLRSVALVCLLTVVTTFEAKGACIVSHMPLMRQVVGQMVVPSGEKCEMFLRTSTNVVEHVRIVRRPRRGSVNIDAGQTVIYRSRKGYAGSDTFTFEALGRNGRGQRAKGTFTVNVTVTR